MLADSNEEKRGIQTPLPVFTLERDPVKNSAQDVPFVSRSVLLAKESPREVRYSI